LNWESVLTKCSFGEGDWNPFGTQKRLRVFRSRGEHIRRERIMQSAGARFVHTLAACWQVTLSQWTHLVQGFFAGRQF
jgi:hypothetical protein